MTTEREQPQTLAATSLTFAAGTQVGQYRLETLLGTGGMGVVYRANCTKLSRPAAVKFLWPQLADVEARRRFRLEAQTASSLNHPHIVTVYDTGEFQDREYLVTEFVDGGTLRHWAREPRSWRQIVELLAGVADALAAAHDAQLVHRDVKPENILVARNGYAKLADFGLAKLAATAHPQAAQTRTGAVLGTIDYMSPEQAAGRTVDARSDIFSFGVVLYELLAGRAPFGGNSDYDRLKAIIDREPPPLPDEIPEALRTLVAKALEKDPADRYQSMREIVVDLRRLAAYRSHTDAKVAAPPQVAKRSGGTWVAVAVVLVGAVGIGAWWAQRPAAAPQNPLDGATFKRFTNFSGDETSASISPDGKFVLFVSDRDQRRDFWLGQVDTEQFQNLTMGRVGVGAGLVREAGFTGDGTQVWLSAVPALNRSFSLLPLMGGASRPFLTENIINADWSPDGTRIAYHTNEPGDPMFVADRDGTNARQLHVAQAGVHNHYPTWSPDGRWIYFVNFRNNLNDSDLWRIAADGGPPERLTERSGYTGYPTPLDERTVLYLAEDKDGGGPWLWTLDVETKVASRATFGLERYTSIATSADHRRLVASVASPIANLWSVPLLDRLASESDARPLRVSTDRAIAPRLSATAVYYLSSLGGGDGLWREENGEAVEIWPGLGSALREPPAISADGERVVVVVRRDGKQSLLVIGADGSQPRVVTDAIDVRGAQSWSPDGQWIATGGIDADGSGLFKIPVDGGTPVRLANVGTNPVWSPRDDLIIYSGSNVGGNTPLGAVTAAGEPVEIPALTVPSQGERVRFLPDGSGIVYMQGGFEAMDFWLLDLETKQTRELTQLSQRDRMRTFDISADGREIVFDRQRQNSDLVLIDLARE